MGFFDKINYSRPIIDNAFKQVRDRRHREVFVTNVPHVGTFHKCIKIATVFYCTVHSLDKTGLFYTCALVVFFRNRL